MYNDKISDLEDGLRRELLDTVSDPTERSHVFTLIKKYNHRTITAVLNDFQLTLEAKRDAILNQFPIE